MLDLAELPTVADRPLLDPNGDGAISDPERDSYLDGKLSEVSPALHLFAGSTALTLRPTAQSLALAPGQAGLDTTRIEATFVADLPPTASDAGPLTFRNDYASDRLGWREIVVANGPDVSIDNSAALAVDQSNALRVYPDDLLSSPLDERTVTVAFQLSPGAPASIGERAPIASGPAGIGQRLEEIVNGGTLSTGGLFLALLAAAGWGAVHALSPGHGKTVVGAYLVGSRGTPRHALFLGLTVTITHTAGVIALGLVILFASRTILPEQLYPWLSLISGLLVAVLGLTILRQRLMGLPAFGHHHHDHDHAHSHDHDHEHAHDHATRSCARRRARSLPRRARAQPPPARRRWRAPDLARAAGAGDLRWAPPLPLGPAGAVGRRRGRSRRVRSARGGGLQSGTGRHPDRRRSPLPLRRSLPGATCARRPLVRHAPVRPSPGRCSGYRLRADDRGPGAAGNAVNLRLSLTSL